MSTFDAVRNRKRGEEAKQRVLDRSYSPKEEKQQESAFSSVRNRQADAPVADPAKGTPMSELLKQTGILFKDPRNPEPTSPFKQSTSPAVTPVQPKTIDFKAAQSAQKAAPLPSPFEGKTLAPINTAPNNIKQTMEGKLPAPSLIQQTGGGPANASQIPGISEYNIREKRIDDTNISEILKLPSRAINKLAFDTPLGLAISNSFQGNSGVTRRDSTGNETVDKVTDAINNLITPLLVPSGAPVGTGPTQGSYDVVGKALSKGLGQKAVNGIAKVIPKASPAAAQNIARVGLTETLAGAPQGVGIGLLNQQDSNEEIQRNALLGVTGGATLGFAGAAAGEILPKLFKRGPSGSPVEVKALDDGINIAEYKANPTTSETNTPVTREQEIYRKYTNDQAITQEEMDFMMGPDWNEDNLIIRTSDTPTPEQKPIATDIKAVEPETLATSEVKPSTVKTEVQEVEEVLEAIKQSNVRDKVYSYLDDAEKAARERIAKRKGQLNSNPLPEWADYAVIMAAKLGKGTIKATNFTEELVKEFGESVRPHGDKILRMSREEIRKQERIASKEGIEALEFNNATTGDTSSFSQKISRDIKVKKKPFAERWQQWRTQASDDLAALSDVEKKVRGGKLASAEDSLYKSARMFKGAPEKASQIVQDRLGSVIQQVEKSGNTVDDLEMFALAKHAQDVNAAGYKSGFTNHEIKSVLDELSSPEMIAAQQELVKVNRDMLKELVDSGVVSKELYDVLGDRWENYIPLFREMESEKVGFDGGMSKALANVTSPIKALQGSEKKVIAPLENMVKNIFQSVNAAERNKVAQQIPKLAELDTDGAFFRKLQNSEVVGEKNVVKVKVNGKEVRYEVEPEIYKALMNLDQESSNTLMNILSKPASLLRAGATLTPEFALRNPIRDINNAFVVSQSGFNPITDFGVGLIQSIKKGDLYKEWIDNLGAYGNTLSMDRNVHKKALETVLKQPNSKKFVNFVTGKSLINVLRAISDTTESATKVGEYRAALRSGASKQEAAYRSRDLMDFARAGSSIRPANKIVAFLNANIQGKSKLIRAIKDNPGGVIARGFASVTVPTMAIFTLNHEFANETQKNTISNAPDWMKDSFWLMAIPGTDTVARIPKPFDLAAVFANLPEKAMAFTLEKDPEAFQGYVNRTLKDASLPTQISGLLPMIEGMANYSFFKEGQIIPRAEQGLEWSDQYDPVRTTSSARIIAGGVEKLTGGKGSFKNFSSPRVVDNTIQGLTAGVGKYVTDAVDVILDKTGVFERTAKPEKSIEQAPFTRAFLVDQNQGGKAMDKFYAMKVELTNEKASAKLNNRPFTKQGQLDSIGNVADALSDINKAIKRIEKGDLSSSQKKEKIEPLIKRRNEMIQRTMKYFKDQNKVSK